MSRVRRAVFAGFRSAEAAVMAVRPCLRLVLLPERGQVLREAECPRRPVALFRWVQRFQAAATDGALSCRRRLAERLRAVEARCLPKQSVKGVPSISLMLNPHLGPFRWCYQGTRTL
jgi:hypothetical protein